MRPALVATSALVLLTLIASVCAAEGGPPKVGVAETANQNGTASYPPGHEGHVTTTHDYALSNDLLTYAIRYTADVDKAHAPYVSPVEGYIGMPQPSACNWYHGGFMRVIIDGDDIGRYPLGDFSALDSGDRGLVRMVWDYPGGQVRISFVLEPGARDLQCQVLLRPKTKPKSVVVALVCYPSAFTSWMHRKGAREITTPASRVLEGEDKTLPGAQNWWAFYDDGVFDVARGEGEGPCGMLAVPKQVKTARFQPSDYPITTTLDLDPDQTDFRFAFWDMPRVTNADGLKLMQTGAAPVLAHLLIEDFRPMIVQSPNVDALRAELAKIVAAVGPSDMTKKAEAALSEAAQSLEAARQGDWQAEKKLAALLRQYDEMVWDLRISALFAE
jgi:hypothetical protein